MGLPPQRPPSPTPFSFACVSLARFELNFDQGGFVLNYYENEESTHLKGHIMLRDVTSVQHVKDLDVPEAYRTSDDGERAQGFGFELATSTISKRHFRMVLYHSLLTTHSLHHSTTPPLHHSTTPPLHHSTTTNLPLI